MATWAELTPEQRKAQVDRLQNALERHRSAAPSRVECHKRQYATRDDALAELAVTRIKAAIGYERRREQRVYECKLCGAWHLTSQA